MGVHSRALAALLLLIHLASASEFSSSPSCNPMVCACNEDDLSADCSGKGFLSTPSGLPRNLRVLDLSRNDLENINATEIAQLEHLETLDLSHNRLTSVFAGVQYNLKSLDLSHNNVSSVRSLHLEGLISLETLSLASNKIISLPPSSFAGSVLLKTLNLRANRIVSLEPGSLDNLTSLEELVLTRNRLSSFPKGLFQAMKSLRVLELNKNKFVEIQGLSFHGLDNLKVLRLKRNQIEYLMDGAFFGLHHIEELALDRNRVNSVSKGWLYGLTTLKYLNLAHNQVEYIAEDGWEFCRELATLDLRSNRLQLLDRDSLRDLPKLKHLHLEDNAISHIQDDDTFAEVPEMETLHLDDNHISHTIEDMRAPFRGLSAMKVLSLSGNQIKSIGERAFLGLESLEELRLRDNVISTVQENAFAETPLLRTIEIDSSSMLCDCYLKWFPRFVNATKIEGAEAATCAHPENLKGRAIVSVAYESFTCDDFPKPYILRHPQTQITLRGDNLTLACRAASTSPAEMTFVWKLDSDVLEHRDCDETNGGRCVKTIAHSFDGKGREITSELRLTELTYDDAGKYQCVVANKFGATYSDKANITVYVFPTFVVTPEDITVKGGADAALTCAARGVPAPKVRFFYTVETGIANWGNSGFFP